MSRLPMPLLSAIAVTLFAVPTLATQTRINSLSGGEKSFTIRDQSNIWVLPQFLHSHTNQVDVDGVSLQQNGEAAYGTMSVRYALSLEATLWVFGRSAPVPVVSATTIGGKDLAKAAGFTDPAFSDPVSHQLGIGFATRVGDNMRLGGALSIAGSRADSSAKDTSSATMINLLLGFGMDLSGVDNTLDFGLSFSYGTFSDVVAGSDRYSPDGLFNFALTAKAEHRVHQIAKVVPYLQFSYDARALFHNARDDAPFTAQDAAKRASMAKMAFMLGSDLAISPSGGEWLVQPGVGLMFATSELNGTDLPDTGVAQIENSSMFAPYYGLAAEARPLEWMTLRVGARQSISSVNFDETPAPQASPQSGGTTVQNNVTLGVGFHNSTPAGKNTQDQRGWKVDLNFNPAMLNNGPNFLTGNTTGNFVFDFAMVFTWN